MRARVILPTSAALVGAGALAYATTVERNWFTLRQAEVPVLAPGTTPIRVLHLSDVHLTPRRKRLMSWLSALDQLEPDLVVNTGDSIAHPEAVPPDLLSLLDAYAADLCGTLAPRRAGKSPPTPEDANRPIHDADRAPGPSSPRLTWSDAVR